MVFIQMEVLVKETFRLDFLCSPSTLCLFHFFFYIHVYKTIHSNELAQISAISKQAYINLKPGYL